MDMWYWVAEYGKVLLGYLFFMFLWPSVVFFGHLKGKSKTYWFGFCVTAPVVISSIVVLVLGFLHILRPQVIVLLFYGTFLAAMIRMVTQHSFTVSSLSFRIKDVWWKYRGNRGEYMVLAALLLFGILYFSYGGFQVHSYGFGDLYTHHAWIYGLKKGEIFSGGVYPEAMHCFVYCLHVLFGLRVFSCLLFLQGIHVAVFLLSGYLLMREIFHWRYTPLLVLTLFLTLDVVSADLVYGIFRLQITLPLEFGLHTQFLCALYLIRYLKNDRGTMRKKKLSQYLRDENLFLFLMSLTAAISIHFYIVLMAFVLCGSFAVFQYKRLLSKEYFVPLAAAVLCACIISLLPMAGAIASGKPFNDSISWAVEAMSGEETRALEKKGSSERRRKPILATSLELAEGICTEGYAELYGKTGACIILLITAGGSGLCWLSRKKSLRKKPLSWLRELCAGYPPLLLFTCLFVLLYAAPRLGYLELISDSRFCSTGHFMIMALVMIPVDVLLSIFSRFLKDVTTMKAVSFFSVAGIYGLTIVTGHFHGYLFFELTRYNEAVETTNRIIEEFPKKSYVVVAPTDELYPVIEYGWHEELLTFVSNIEEEEYTFAPEHAFFFVEKKPLQYAQAYFFEGPPWLAKAKYKDIYWDKYSKKYLDTGAAQAPEINASEISEEEAEKDMIVYEDPWFSYTRLPARTILEAKAYAWCQEMAKRYPENMEIYYEDDAFVCYYFRQDGGRQYNLRAE